MPLIKLGAMLATLIPTTLAQGQDLGDLSAIVLLATFGFFVWLINWGGEAFEREIELECREEAMHHDTLATGLNSRQLDP